MNQRLYAAAVPVSGLLTAQAVAAVHIYFSNIMLWRSIDAVMRAGYLAVPNAHVAASLRSVLPAMAGGVFFSLSVGAALSLVTWGAAWTWDRIFCRRPNATRCIIGLWIAALLLFNLFGFNLVASVYLITVPAVTWTVAVKWMPARPAPGSLPLSLAVIPVIPVIVLAVLWGPVMDTHIFSSIRDRVLLSNAPGRWANDFYYTYTLFPAQAFKSVNQKQIRACTIDPVKDRVLLSRLESTLRRNDYLPVSQIDNPDLQIEFDPKTETLLFKKGKNIVLTRTPDAFFKAPAICLKAYSDQCDPHGLFRSLTFFSLFFGFPVVLYAMLFSALDLVLCLFFTRMVSQSIGAAVCLAAGVALLIPVYLGSLKTVSPVYMNSALTADSLGTRIAALKRICRDKKDITGFAGYADLAESPHMVERYWLAKGLGYAKHPQTGRLLLALLNDPSPIVVCRALGALGQQGKPSVIRPIIHKIRTSTQWYEQFCGYRALRSLGWVQPKSKQPF